MPCYELLMLSTSHVASPTLLCGGGKSLNALCLPPDLVSLVSFCLPTRSACSCIRRSLSFSACACPSCRSLSLRDGARITIPQPPFLRMPARGWTTWLKSAFRVTKSIRQAFKGGQPPRLLSFVRLQAQLLSVLCALAFFVCACR